MSSWKTCAGAVFALLVHEAGHYCASRMVHERIDRLELTPFGGVMHYEEGKSPCKGIRGACVAIAGPTANYLALLCLTRFSDQFDTALMRAVLSSGIVMILVNMLPALPLDGGRLIFCLGYYIFPVTALISCLAWAGVLSGILLIGFAVYGAISYGILNCSLVIVGGYLVICAWKSRRQMMLENLYTVIQEAGDMKQNLRKIQTYRVPLDTGLIQLLPLLGGRVYCDFVAEMDKDEIRISENALRAYIIENPMLSMRDLFAQKSKG